MPRDLIRRSSRTAVPLAAMLALAACGQTADAPAAVAGELTTGFWHATVALPGGTIDAGLEISSTGGRYQASLINGRERVPIGEVTFAGGDLTMRFPAFNSEIRASLGEQGLDGELVLVKRYGETQTMPFRATAGAARNDPDVVANTHDVSGRWAVQFDNADGSTSPAIGEFAQRGSKLFGTFLSPAGDYRYLAGHVRGNELKLSTFDGAHAYVFTGRIDGDRIDGGNFWSGTEWHQTWSAVRNADVTLPDAYTQTYLKPGYERLDFSFPDLAGNVVSLADERFAGKVVIVTLAGSWCPNSHDAARVIAPLYEQHRDRGLEVVSLMYEHFEDPARAAEQVRQFRRKLGIEYHTLLAGVSDKALASETLPALNRVQAIPTTIFIDRGGRVRSVHTGFNGPGTGSHHEKLKGEFQNLVTTLLAEPLTRTGTPASVCGGVH